MDIQNTDAIGPQIPLLGHGYIQLVERWGSDERIIRSARQSTDKGFLGWAPYDECRRCKAVAHRNRAYAAQFFHCTDGGEHDWRNVPEGDVGLLHYLWKNKHSTPFEFGGLTIEVQAPIMVFREWHRHRVPFGYSELSARYAPMPNLHYMPSLQRVMRGGGHLTKQAAAFEGALDLTVEAALDWLEKLNLHYEREQELYEYGLKIGVPKELARLPISVGRFSRMRATGNLRGWLGFCGLRRAPGAQEEIRVYAEQLYGFIGQTFPRTALVVESS